MYLVQVNRNVARKFATVTFLAKTSNEVNEIPYLAQSINENEMTSLPENGTYCAVIQGENVVISQMGLDVAVTLGFTFEPFTTKLLKADKTAGNGTGQILSANANNAKAERLVEMRAKLNGGKSTIIDAQNNVKTVNDGALKPA